MPSHASGPSCMEGDDMAPHAMSGLHLKYGLVSHHVEQAQMVAAFGQDSDIVRSDNMRYAEERRNREQQTEF